MNTKKEIFERYKKEYYKAKVAIGGRSTLAEIISTVKSVTGMHPKSIIRAFNRMQKRHPLGEEQRGRHVYYTPDTTAALKDIWETGGEVCAELLHPIVTDYVSILKRDKMWSHGDEATGKLLSMSMGTMKSRVGDFFKIRRKGRGISSTSPSLIKNIIPNVAKTIKTQPHLKNSTGLLVEFSV